MLLSSGVVNLIETMKSREYDNEQHDQKVRSLLYSAAKLSLGRESTHRPVSNGILVERLYTCS